MVEQSGGDKLPISERRGQAGGTQSSKSNKRAESLERADEGLIADSDSLVLSHVSSQICRLILQKPAPMVKGVTEAAEGTRTRKVACSLTEKVVVCAIG